MTISSIAGFGSPSTDQTIITFFFLQYTVCCLEFKVKNIITPSTPPPVSASLYCTAMRKDDELAMCSMHMNKRNTFRECKFSGELFAGEFRCLLSVFGSIISWNIEVVNVL